jgi:hypothetical protein
MVTSIRRLTPPGGNVDPVNEAGTAEELAMDSEPVNKSVSDQWVVGVDNPFTVSQG